MNDALSLSKNCLVPEDSWRTMQHFSAVLFPKGGHVLLFFVKGIVFVWAAVLAICCILELESLICVLFAALMWCWKIGESEHHPKRHLWPEWIKMTWNRFFKGAQAGLRLLLGVSLVSPWCLQATWKVSQEPFFDSRLIVETSALFIAASFGIRHLDQISGPVADNLMHMQRMQLNTFEMRLYETWSCPKYMGIFRHPCLDSTQFLGLRETCEFRFSMWMRCQPSWSNLSQLNRFGFRAGQPWLQMFDPTGPEWFVRFRPPP